MGAVGQANVYPNSRNVIPGRAVFTIDFRSPDLAKLTSMRAELEAEAPRIAAELGLGIEIEPVGHFDPVTFDPALVKVVRGAAERREAIAAAVQAARHTRDLITATGLPVPLVTGSGTGTLVHEAASGVYGELQAGSFLFMDADYARNERESAQPAFEHALFVKTQVISARATHVVCDAGHKSHAIDSGLPLVHGLPPRAGAALRQRRG